MMYFVESKLEYILKVGNSKYDIRTDSEMSSEGILQRIISFGTKKDIVEFLDYQFNNNEFKFSFLSIFYFNSGDPSWILDSHIKIIVKEWLFEKFPIDVAFLGGFYGQMLSYSSSGFNKASLSSKLMHRTKEEQIGILEFSRELAEEGIKLHRFGCTEIICDVESAYIMKIDFINEKLIELEPKVDITNLKQIQWNGTQKQLAELFVELRKKGWIDDYNYKTIKACFTKSNTIDQVLKPNTDTSSGQNKYEGIYTKFYDSMFKLISENKKPSK